MTLENWFVCEKKKGLVVLAQIMFVTPSMGEPEFLCPGADT